MLIVSSPDQFNKSWTYKFLMFQSANSAFQKAFILRTNLTYDWIERVIYQSKNNNQQKLRHSPLMLYSPVSMLIVCTFSFNYIEDSTIYTDQELFKMI